MISLIRFVPAVSWMVAIFFVSAQSRLPSPPVAFEGLDKVLHAGAYGLLAALLLFGSRGSKPWALAALAALYGASDEVHQAFVPGRSADVFDWLADSAGAILMTAYWLRRSSSPEQSTRV